VSIISFGEEVEFTLSTLSNSHDFSEAKITCIFTYIWTFFAHIYTDDLFIESKLLTKITEIIIFTPKEGVIQNVTLYTYFHYNSYLSIYNKENIKFQQNKKNKKDEILIQEVSQLKLKWLKGWSNSNMWKLNAKKGTIHKKRIPKSICLWLSTKQREVMRSSTCYRTWFSRCSQNLIWVS